MQKRQVYLLIRHIRESVIKTYIFMIFAYVLMWCHLQHIFEC